PHDEKNFDHRFDCRRCINRRKSFGACLARSRSKEHLQHCKSRPPRLGAWLPSSPRYRHSSLVASNGSPKSRRPQLAGCSRRLSRLSLIAACRADTVDWANLLPAIMHACASSRHGGVTTPSLHRNPTARSRSGGGELNQIPATGAAHYYAVRLETLIG